MKPKRKGILHDMDKPEEKELWEWLQGLPHGMYSERTKDFWMKRMKSGKKFESELEREGNES